MTSARSDRGAVHILVLVVCLVIGLIGWVLWYQAFSSFDKSKASEAEQRKRADNSQADYFSAKVAYDHLANLVGGVAPLTPPGEDDRDDPDEWKKKYTAWHRGVQSKITEEVNVFGGDRSIATLTGVFAPAEAKMTQLQAEIDTLKRDLATARTEAEGSRRSVTVLGDQHGQALNAKNQELVTNRERLESQLAESERKNEEGSQGLRRLTDEFNAAVAKYGDQIRGIKAAFEGHDREVTVLKSHLKTERVWAQPDGRVLEVDAAKGTAWIDLGSNHMLRRGTRFTAYGIKKGNVRDEHGVLVVHDIIADRAMCAIENGAPIVAGDYVTNPFFDRNGRKIFYFLGQLPGRFDNQTAQRILEDFGASVTDKMSVHLDFIVIGDDPNPEISPENMNAEWFKDTPQYNDALRWGIETIRARDLETYIQF